MDININRNNNPDPPRTPAIEDRVFAIEIRADHSTFPPAAVATSPASSNMLPTSSLSRLKQCAPHSFAREVLLGELSTLWHTLLWGDKWQSMGRLVYHDN
jgi:hypothetical protein